MLKAINGPYRESDPHSTGVRAYARAGGIDSVVIPAPRWEKYEPSRGQFDESQWAAYDEQITAAHEDGLRTYPCIGSGSPAWAIALQVAGRSPPRASGWRLAPDDRTAGGPWGSFVEKVLMRHPRVQGIVVINEPNAGYMDGQHSALHTAQLMKSAATIWHHHQASPRLMGPGTLDGPGAVTFTGEVLAAMRQIGWLPRGWTGRLGWAHHPYTDVHNGLPTAAREPQVRQVLDLLAKWNWHPGRRIWLTEGGWQYATRMTSEQWRYTYVDDPPLSAQEQTQVDHLTRHVRWCKALDPAIGTVEMWATYLFKDHEWGGGGFMSGLVRLDGTNHPIHGVWPKL